MKRSKKIVLLFVAAGVMSGCSDETKPNALRQRRDAQGQLVYDSNGNPVYEDDEGQHYSHVGGHFYPFFVRSAGYSTIPGTGIAAPATSTPLTPESITSRRVPVARGGFGSTGSRRSFFSGS